MAWGCESLWNHVRYCLWNLHDCFLSSRAASHLRGREGVGQQREDAKKSRPRELTARRFRRGSRRCKTGCRGPSWGIAPGPGSRRRAPEGSEEGSASGSWGRNSWACREREIIKICEKAEGTKSRALTYFSASVGYGRAWKLASRAECIWSMLPVRWAAKARTRTVESQPETSETTEKKGGGLELTSLLRVLEARHEVRQGVRQTLSFVPRSRARLLLELLLLLLLLVSVSDRLQGCCRSRPLSLR